MGQRTAVISDIHGNSPALRAVLEDVYQEGCGRLFVLGDVINGVDPGACVDLLMGRANTDCLLGNAEFYLLTPRLDVFPRREEWMYASVIRILTWFRDRLTREQIAWLAAWPVNLVWGQVYMVHDSPLDRIESAKNDLDGMDECYRELLFHGAGIWQKMPDEYWERLAGWMRDVRCAALFCGHTHEPFIRSWDGVTVCNAGSVGQPQDGDPRASWLLVDTPDGENLNFSIRRTSYDVDETIAMLDAAQGYETPEMVEARKRMLQTGRHWRAYYQPPKTEGG